MQTIDYTLYIALFAAMMLLCGVYAWWQQRSVKRAAAALAETDPADPAEVLHRLLDKEYAFLREWMGNAPIDAFTEASLPEDPILTPDEAMKKGKALFSIMAQGLKEHYAPKEEQCAYWVLSGRELHLLIDREIDDEHLIFDAFRVKDAVMTDGGLLRGQMHTASTLDEAVRLARIAFDIDGKQKVYCMHDRLALDSAVGTMLHAEKMAREKADKRLMGTYFFKTLCERFPNLHCPWTLGR